MCVCLLLSMHIEITIKQLAKCEQWIFGLNNFVFFLSSAWFCWYKLPIELIQFDSDRQSFRRILFIFAVEFVCCFWKAVNWPWRANFKINFVVCVYLFEIWTKKQVAEYTFPDLDKRYLFREFFFFSTFLFQE